MDRLKLICFFRFVVQVVVLSSALILFQNCGAVEFEIGEGGLFESSSTDVPNNPTYMPLVFEDFEGQPSGQNAFGSMVYDAAIAFSGAQSMRVDFTDGSNRYGGTRNLPEGVGVGETIWYRVYLYMPSTLSLSYGDVSGDGFGWNKFFVLSRNRHDPPRMYVQPRSSYKVNFGEAGFYGTGLYVNHDGLGNSYCRLQEDSYTFPRDQWFALQMSWKVESDSSAHVRVWSDEEFIGECTGAGQVDADYVVQSYGLGDYWNGGAWIKENSTGSFWVDDIVVTKETPSSRDSGGRPFIHPDDFRFTSF